MVRMDRSSALALRARVRVLGSLAALAALTVAGCAPAAAAPASASASDDLVTTGTPQPATIDAATIAGERADIAWPDGVQAAAFEVEGLDGAIDASGDDGRLPMASIAKLVLVLTVLERMPLESGQPGPTLTVTETDLALRSQAARRGAAVMPMQLGQQLTQRQLLDAAMLQSSANAATSLAQWAFGSQEAYVAEANAWLDEHDLADVEVVDATGLSRRNVARASDLVQLMDHVDRQPLVREITGQWQADIPGLGVVANTNRALGHAGIDSGKTGSLNASGQTVLVGATAVVGGQAVRIHAALLGVRGVSRDAAVARLVASVAAQVVEREVLAVGDPVPVFDVTGPTASQLHAATAVTTVAWRETDLEVAVALTGQVDSATPDAAIAVRVRGPSGEMATSVAPAGPMAWEWRIVHVRRVTQGVPEAV